MLLSALLRTFRKWRYPNRKYTAMAPTKVTWKRYLFRTNGFFSTKTMGSVADDHLEENSRWERTEV